MKEEKYQIVYTETEKQIKELQYLLKFKKEKAKLEKLAKLERVLELITEMHAELNTESRKFYKTIVYDFLAGIGYEPVEMEKTLKSYMNSYNALVENALKNNN